MRDDDVARWVRRGICRVPATGAGSRLDAYLARQFPYRSRTRWHELIRRGRIRVNDGEVRPGRALRPGDRIEYVPDPRPEPRIDRRYRILHEDDWLLAVRKPANLPVHPSGRYFQHTLLMLLLADRGQDLGTTDLRIVHRLDRETSGIILFGKGREAAAHLAGQFEFRRVRKTYLALVHGRPRETRFLVDAPVGPDPSSPVRKAMTVTGAGRTARTLFRVLRLGPDHALVEARPLTGRLHQIRVHLRHAGLPIVGDKVYGLDPHLFIRFVGGTLSESDRRRLVWGRQALHAWKLRIHHPQDDRRIELRAPVGARWLARMRELGLEAA